MTKHGSDTKNDQLDQTVEDSFPASDPPSQTPASHVGTHGKRDDSERPTGQPNSDRHATETAYQKENEVKPRK